MMPRQNRGNNIYSRQQADRDQEDACCNDPPAHGDQDVFSPPAPFFSFSGCASCQIYIIIRVLLIIPIHFFSPPVLRAPQVTGCMPARFRPVSSEIRPETAEALGPVARFRCCHIRDKAAACFFYLELFPEFLRRFLPGQQLVSDGSG